MLIYEILPALDLTQSVHAKISIGMHRGVKFKIFRIPLIGLETVPGRFAPNPVRPLSRFAPNPVRPPESFRPDSRSPRVVSLRFKTVPGRFAPNPVHPESRSPRIPFAP